VPSDYERISGDDNDGVWQSAHYGDSERQIIIRYDGGVGGLTVR
jgi:hypothetical protein